MPGGITRRTKRELISEPMHHHIRKLLKSALKREVCRAAFITWYVLLFVLSSIPGREAPKLEFLLSDKIAHTIYFCIGSTALLLTLLQHPSRHYSLPCVFLACVAMACVVGGFDEWHQTFTPNRDGNSPGDLLANLTGGALGFCVGLWVKKHIINPHDLASQQ